MQAQPQESLAAIKQFPRPDDRRARPAAGRRSSAPRDGAFFRALVQNAADPIIVVDMQAAVTYVHPSVKDILGYAPEELLGRSAFDYIAPGDKPQALLAFGKAIPDRNARISACIGIRHKNGSIRTLEGSCVNSLYDPAVQALFSADTTSPERRRGEEELDRPGGKSQSSLKNAKPTFARQQPVDGRAGPAAESRRRPRRKRRKISAIFSIMFRRRLHARSRRADFIRQPPDRGTDGLVAPGHHRQGRFALAAFDEQYRNFLQKNF